MDQTAYEIKNAKENVAEILSNFEEQLKARTYLHMGYPYNLDYDYTALHNLIDFSINNLGDPFIESNYGVHSRAFEVAVLDWFADLWGLRRDDYWGYMTACGTEGNLYGIWLGREWLTQDSVNKQGANRKIVLLSSREAHYSVWKAARMFYMDPKPIETQPNGEIDYDVLLSTLRDLKTRDKRIVIVANVGTTIKGAVDDVDKIIKIAEQAGLTEDDYFLHIDGALFGIMLPYLEAKEGKKRMLSFRAKPNIGSISVSGHKFLGSPVPCGVVITRKQYISCLSNNISYIASRDATILGSRNGHAPLFLWYALVKKGDDGLAKDVQECMENAKYMKASLVENGVQDVMLNERSSTVVFAKPKSEALIKKWQLACDRNICHVVVMPNVQKEKIDELVAEIVADKNT